jgi:hypothetical protein
MSMRMPSPPWRTAEIRLLERVSDCSVESELCDVLWEMVEMVHHSHIVGDDATVSASQSEIDDPVELMCPEECDCEQCNYLFGSLSLSPLTCSSESEEEYETEARLCDRCNHEHAPDMLCFGSLLRSCTRCHHSEQVILSRATGWEDHLELQDMGSGEVLICRSCLTGTPARVNDFCCVDCGYSETLSKQYHGEQLGQFYLEGETRPEYQDENTRCHGCRARVERYERHDGPDLVNRVLFLDEEWEETYDGELDLAEEDEDNEDNEDTDGSRRTREWLLRMKKHIQEIGEVVFDIKENISEGEYLKIMDGLQSITNEMNN